MKQLTLLWCLAIFTLSTLQGQAVLFNNISSPTVIRATDIPITISTPGRYILVEDASYNASTNVPAISITDSLLSPIVQGASVVFEIQDMPEPALRTLVAPMCLVQALAIGMDLAAD